MTGFIESYLTGMEFQKEHARRRMANDSEGCITKVPKQVRSRAIDYLWFQYAATASRWGASVAMELFSPVRQGSPRGWQQHPGMRIPLCTCYCMRISARAPPSSSSLTVAWMALSQGVGCSSSATSLLSRPESPVIAQYMSCSFHSTRLGISCISRIILTFYRCKDVGRCEK